MDVIPTRHGCSAGLKSQALGTGTAPDSREPNAGKRISTIVGAPTPQGERIKTFATQAARHDNIAAMNITPLVDVMLVLLVIFMIAVPIVTQRIGMDLPGAVPPQARTEPPPPITLRIDAAGQLYWNGDPTPTGSLQTLLEAERARDGTDARVLQIDASGDADYGAIARVLAAARNAQWSRVGFVGR